jgi:transposase-like protein
MVIVRGTQGRGRVLEVGAGVPVTEVAHSYGVSRQSVHAWLRRYGCTQPVA